MRKFLCYIFLFIPQFLLAQNSGSYNSSFDSLYQKAYYFCEAMDFKSAQKCLDSALVINKQFKVGEEKVSFVYYLKAFCLRRTDAKDAVQLELRAISFLNKAIAIDSTRAFFFYERALAKKMSHQQKSAITDLNKAIQLNPTNFMYYDERNTCHFLVNTPYRIRKNDLYQGIKNFQSMEDSANKYYYVARSYQLIFQFMNIKAFLDTSLQFYDKAIIASAGMNDEIFYERGVLYRNDASNYPLAIEDFKKAISLNPSFLSAHLNLAWSYNFNNQPERAYEVLISAQKLFPDDWQIKQSLREIKPKLKK